jgi:thiol-disulfide isomerase/thioredoxin
MLERLVVLVVLALAVGLTVLGVRTWNAARTRRLLGQSGTQAWASLSTVPDGRPAVVQFSTASCAACHTAQAPAIARLEQQLGSAALRVIKVDAAAQPEVARAFGVLTVPSTVVLDPDGAVRAVNQGFASTARLLQQLGPPLRQLSPGAR